MGNKYKVTGSATLDDLMWDEDREVKNNLRRAKTDYYTTLNSLNVCILKIIESMTQEERKEMLKRCSLKLVATKKETE